MKTFLILLFSLFLTNISFSQKHINSKENFNEYFDNIVILKLKHESRDFFNNKELVNLIPLISEAKINKMFPDSQIPEKKYNERGEKLVDLSLIYQINYRESIDVISVTAYLNKLEYFEYAEPLYHDYLLSYVPDDPMNQTDQYWLDNIRAYDAWGIHKGDTNVFIGIVDTGIDISHEDLIWNIKYNYNDMITGNDDDNDGYVDNFRGWDFGDNNNNPQAEVSFHGSWVSGIASASTDNSVGMSGVGFKCRFLPIKVMNSNGVMATAYQGLVYAADKGSQVINCSWGNTVYQNMAQDVINYATYNRDALVIGAAGNTNSEVLFYPAAYENVISVAATTVDDEKWTPENTGTSSGSSYSPTVDISAPGTRMRTTNDGNYMLTYGGTSFAAPVVSGAAALLRSYFPDLSGLQIGELLKISTDCIDTVPANENYAGMLGTGRLNIYNAMTMEQTPSIVLKDIVISDDRSINDIVYISGNFTNYLAPTSTNAKLEVSSSSPFVQVLFPEISIGQLNTMQSRETNEQIAFRVQTGTPYDHGVFIDLKYVDGDYEGVQSVFVKINHSYKQISSNNLDLSIVKNGRLGYSDINASIGKGLRYKNSRLFYDSGIISGTGPENIYCAVRKNTDFKTIELPKYIENSDLADTHIVTKFDDSNDAHPYGIVIKQTALAWDKDEYSNFIIVNYDIVNEGDEDIESYYFGIFNDWDLVDPNNNSVIYDESNNIMYAKHNGAQTMFAGLKLLSNQNANNYGLAQVSGGDGIIDLTNGFSDIEKFHAISNSTGEIDSEEDGSDIVIINSAGPIDIPKGDTVRVSFAYIAHESRHKFFEAVNYAQLAYYSIYEESLLPDSNKVSFSLYPNPTFGKASLIFDGNLLGKEVEISIMNIEGKILSNERKKIKQVKHDIDLSNFKTGTYFVRIKHSNYTNTKKIMVLP